MKSPLSFAVVKSLQAHSCILTSNYFKVCSGVEKWLKTKRCFSDNLFIGKIIYSIKNLELTKKKFMFVLQ